MILRVAQRTVKKCIGTSLVVETFLLFNQNICCVYSELESVLTCSLLQKSKFGIKTLQQQNLYLMEDHFTFII